MGMNNVLGLRGMAYWSTLGIELRRGSRVATDHWTGIEGGRIDTEEM